MAVANNDGTGTSISPTFKKIVIMSACVEGLNLLQSKLNENKIPSYFIYGKIANTKRSDILKHFNDDDDDSVKILLLSEDCGSVG